MQVRAFQHLGCQGVVLGTFSMMVNNAQITLNQPYLGGICCNALPICCRFVSNPFVDFKLSHIFWPSLSNGRLTGLQ